MVGDPYPAIERLGDRAAVIGAAKSNSAVGYAAERIREMKKRVDEASSRIARYADDLLGPVPAEVGEAKSEPGTVRDLISELDKLHDSIGDLEGHLRRFES